MPFKIFNHPRWLFPFKEKI